MSVQSAAAAGRRQRGAAYTPTDWPAPLADAAYHGLAGDVVRAIAPQSEADPVALLLQFLAAFGNVAGRSHCVRMEGDAHPPQLWPVIVGPTSKGRKGTAWGRVQQIFAVAVPEWAADHVASGLSSGEGLLQQVRDPIRHRVKDKKSGEYVEEELDPGVDDKRLLVREGEFASVLRHFERAGNTLSVTLRTLWDSGDARTLTKTSPLRTTGAMVSVIGHITAEELRRYLTRTETANGFANRFLFICARRSQSLPFGGERVEVAGFAERLVRQLGRLAWRRKVIWTGEAAEIWAGAYDKLSEGRPGLLGAVISRAEAQTLRLALTYALLDGKAQIRAEHVDAALAVWRYCEASAVYLFGDSLGDPVADEILRTLKAAPDGLTRTEIRDLFWRNQSAAAISAALTALLAQGLARFASEATAGRPVERWTATAPARPNGQQGPGATT